MILQQLNLLAEPRARHDNPETSHKAAARQKANNGPRLQRIAAIVEEAGWWGCTRDEIYQRLILEEPSLKPDTSSAAVSRAKGAGLIVPAGPKQVRLSARNEPQEIYVHPGCRR